MKATDHGPVNPDARGEQRLYKLDPPLNDDGYMIHWVVVSAADVPFSGPETYIFPADFTGKVTDWSELPGSQRGEVSHADALADMGYTVVEKQG